MYLCLAIVKKHFHLLCLHMQVQELVSKALAQVAQQQGQVQEESISSMIIEEPTPMQATEYYESTQIITQEEASLQHQEPQEHLTIKLEEEPQHQDQPQHIYVTQDEPKQEVLATLKPEQLELVMTQVENEFTEKTVPYRLKAVEPEEIEDIQKTLKLKRRTRNYDIVIPAKPDLKEEVPMVVKLEMAEGASDAVDGNAQPTPDDELSEVMVKDNRCTDSNNEESKLEFEAVLNAESEEVAGLEQESEVGVTPKPKLEPEPKPIHQCSYDECDFQGETELDLQRHLKTFHSEEHPFQCSFCMKEFKLELSLKVHLLGHQEIPALDWEVGSKAKKLYNCPLSLCDFKSFYKRPLIQHVKEEHDLSCIFTCERCKIAFMTHDEMDEHCKSQIHEENQWSLCSICGASSKHMSQHMRRVHSDEKPYWCTQCDYKCKFSGALKAHLLTHKSEREFKCDQCTYSARSRDQLKRHEIIHSNVKDKKCPHCNYATQTIYRLKKHLKIHTNVTKGYRCIMCDFVTHDKIILKQHKADVHGKKLNLACRECNIEFSSVQELKVHALATHKSTNSWFCKYCNFSCASRRELGIHMQTHAGKHRYVCKICGYSCRQSNPFKRHLARHNKIKSFTCTMCNYACTDKYDLEKHLITHSEVKSVVCPDCPYTCRYKAQLVRHKKLVHDDIKPYFCSYCNYTTKSPQNLKNHMHLHAEKKPHQCMLCEFSACQKSNLKRHMQTHLKKAQIVYVQA